MVKQQNKKLSLSGGKLTLGSIEAGQLRGAPSLGAGRRTVQVEVRRKRAPAAPQRGGTPRSEVEAPSCWAVGNRSTLSTARAASR